MQKLWLAIVGICVLSWFSWLGWQWRSRSAGNDTIEYRGQKIKLSKFYSDYDDYKNDPDNIAAWETARVQKLVIEAPVGQSFPNRLALFQGLGQVEFPGYGLGSGAGKTASGGDLLPVDIEIPRAQKNRNLLFRVSSGNYELIDDFVESEIAYPYSPADVCHSETAGAVLSPFFGAHLSRRDCSCSLRFLTLLWSQIHRRVT